MQRYFIDHLGDYVDGDDYFHIKQVMRMKVNEEIEICRDKKCYKVVISDISDKVYFKNLVLLKTNVSHAHITLIQGLGKSDKQEIVCKYATQFGVSEVVFVPMQRSIAKYDDKSHDKKMDRLQKIALEASRLSHRDDVPKISYLTDLKKHDFDYDHKWIAYENDKEESLIDKVLKVEKGDRIALVVGPEGGISDAELLLLKEKGFVTIGLGNRILQTEVASLYPLSVIDACLQTRNL